MRPTDFDGMYGLTRRVGGRTEHAPTVIATGDYDLMEQRLELLMGRMREFFAHATEQGWDPKERG
jgi:hypothetical protein